MGDLAWTHRKCFGFPLKALRHHAVILGSSGSGKTETLLRVAFGAHHTYQLQVIYLDAKGETKRGEEESEDNAARFLAVMREAGAHRCAVFPSTFYNGWQGTSLELKNRLLAVVDFSESAYYGDVAANVLDLALGTPTTPRSSSQFLANLRIDRLKILYQHDRQQYQRVLALDKALVEQVEMRYQVFFSALAGQLDGTLDYGQVDAAYLRVRGFELQNEAPRLGRFLVADFKHYLSNRRRPGVKTLFMIDEFNALRMREETSLLFEQCRSFGGSLIISAQGYAGLGPPAYAERILDACSTFILHSCSDPFQVSKRAGKQWRMGISWSEDSNGILHKQLRSRDEWKVSERVVIQQETGQAYWIHHGRTQQVQIAPVPLIEEQVQAAWGEIRRQEAAQRQHLAEQAQCIPPAKPSATNTANASATKATSVTNVPSVSSTPSIPISNQQPSLAQHKSRATSKAVKKVAIPSKTSPGPSVSGTPEMQGVSSPTPPVLPIPDPDDDGPDEL